MSKEKSEKDVRNIPVTVRLNEEESEKLKQYAAACGLSSAEFMRQLCKGNAPQPEPPAEFWQLLNTLYEVHAAFKSVFPTILPPPKSVKRLKILYWNYNRPSHLHSVLMWKN